MQQKQLSCILKPHSIHSEVTKIHIFCCRRHKQPLSKEIAFTKAIISAGIVHTITKNCTKGHLANCGCDKVSSGDKQWLTSHEINFKKGYDRNMYQTDWSWGACSDDTHYADKVAKEFFDTFENDEDPQGYASLHNALVGRRVSVLSDANFNNIVGG